MKKDIFIEVLSGIQISNDAIEPEISIKTNRLTEGQYKVLKNELNELYNFVEELKPIVMYELWEVDYVYHKLIRKINIPPVEGIEDARVIAKHLAKSWCVNEKPIMMEYGEDESWGGDSDFGIMIKK